jgi:hypothetical protein
VAWDWAPGAGESLTVGCCERDNKFYAIFVLYIPICDNKYLEISGVCESSRAVQEKFCSM